MRIVRVALALVALVLALARVLLARDVGRWREQIAAGDRRLAANPVAPSTGRRRRSFRSTPRGGCVGLGDDIALREAIRAFVDRAAHRARASTTARSARSGGRGRGGARGRRALRVPVAGRAGGRPARRARVREDLGARRASRRRAARASHAFTEAARLDPSERAAKFDLELTLRALAPNGTRPGSNPSAGGKGPGHRGAGAGLPGSGF